MGFIKTQNVGMLPTMRVTVTGADARCYNYYGKEGEGKRIVGSFVWLQFTPHPEHNHKPIWQQYSCGKLDFTCPAATVNGPIPWQQLDIENPDMDSQLVGRYLWSNVPGAHVPKNSNFGFFCDHLESAGYPEDRVDTTHNYIDLVQAFLGCDAQATQVPQPDRGTMPNRKAKKGDTDDATSNPMIYIFEKIYGFTEGVIAGTSGAAVSTDHSTVAKEGLRLLLAAGKVLKPDYTELMKVSVTGSADVPGFNIQPVVEALSSLQSDFSNWVTSNCTVTNGVITGVNP